MIYRAKKSAKMDKIKLKNLPLGIQTFKDIIESDCLYIDKTNEIYKLLEGEEKKYFFLSRPRRFGKSLLISTLEQIFLGNKELFKDLWIYEKIEWKKYPVIRIDFTSMTYTEGVDYFKESFLNEIKNIASKYQIDLKSNNYKEAFKELIKELSKIEKVVILIDEYDKPITNFVDKIEIAFEMREILKNFYETIKACDEYINFAFLTGVSKFAKISVFSGLNNLTDITLDEKFSTITGYTEEELYYYFKERISLLAIKLDKNLENLKNKIKTWYNGYSWDGKNFVYNPYSILLLFNQEVVKNYWFETATPTLLIKLIKKYNVDIKKLDKCLLSEDDFSSYEVDSMNVYALLFQTGYLTIKEIIQSDYEREYLLSYPNMEVKDSLLKSILNDFIESKMNDNNISILSIVKTLEKNDLDGFFEILKDIFSHIPAVIFMADKEAYYHTIFYLILTLIGVRIKAEIHTNKGRIDAVIETDEKIYIIEFKMSSTTQALKQIKDRKYYESYLLSKKEILLIGVSFDSEERNIKNWEIKNLN